MKSNWYSKQSLLMALLTGALILSCAPAAQQNPPGNQPAPTAPSAPSGNQVGYLQTNGTTVLLNGPSANVVFPANGGVIQGVDGPMSLIFGVGAPQPASGTGYVPPYSCAGYEAQLQRVALDGTVTNVGSTADVSPFRQGQGSPLCNDLAARVGLTTGADALVRTYSLAELGRLPNIRGYRVVLTSPKTDYRYVACQTQPGWQYPYFWLNPSLEQSCRAQYPMTAIYQTHVLAARIAVQFN